MTEKDRCEGYAYRITEIDVKDIPAFKDRDIIELQPMITILKCGSRKHKFFQVNIQLGNICSKQVGFFEILKTDFYPFEQTFDGVYDFILSRLKNFDWNDLLEEFDEKNETYEDYLRRISDEVKC